MRLLSKRRESPEKQQSRLMNKVGQSPLPGTWCSSSAEIFRTHASSTGHTTCWQEETAMRSLTCFQISPNRECPTSVSGSEWPGWRLNSEAPVDVNTSSPPKCLLAFPRDGPAVLA